MGQGRVVVGRGRMGCMGHRAGTVGTTSAIRELGVLLGGSECVILFMRVDFWLCTLYACGCIGGSQLNCVFKEFL